MPRRRNPVPTYRLHKPTGQAVCTVRSPEGGRRDVYLGLHGTQESRQAYARLVAELTTTPSASLPTATIVRPRPDPSVNELLIAFLRHADRHYRRPDGTATNEVVEFKIVGRALRELYGFTPVGAFGPLALKAVRQKWVTAGLARPTINARVNRVRRIFKWAVGEELVPVGVHQGLAAVQGLGKGRTEAREPDPVGPVQAEHVETTLRHLSPTVAAMVRFQQLTGCRPQDVCGLRGDQIDRSQGAWVFRPRQHKTAWRGRGREVYIGPRAMVVLEPFLAGCGGEYVFSPAREAERLRAERAAARKTPRYLSHMERNAAKRVADPKRRPGGRYSTSSYDHAVERACERAGVPHWHPNQLRHAFATEVRRRYGVEAAQVLLGHEKCDVTQVYAEKNVTLALRVAAELG